jgi:ethylmalonyl-CoA/methylmalonyl-CoA decarboxylase
MSLTFTFKNQIANINHSAPETSNAFSVSDALELNKILKKIPKSCKGLLWTANTERLFCSGGDLKYYAKLKKRPDGIQANRKIRLALKGLSEINFPTAVAMDGDAFGGGIELISCFDFVVCENHTLLGLWQRKIGLTYGWGGGERLVKRISQSKLKGLALEAKNISAFEALEIGLVDSVVRKGLSKDKALGWLQRQSTLSPVPVKVIKNSKNLNLDFEKIWLNEDHKKVLAKRR